MKQAEHQDARVALVESHALSDVEREFVRLERLRDTTYDRKAWWVAKAAVDKFWAEHEDELMAPLDRRFPQLRQFRRGPQVVSAEARKALSGGWTSSGERSESGPGSSIPPGV